MRIPGIRTSVAELTEHAFIEPSMKLARLLFHSIRLTPRKRRGAEFGAAPKFGCVGRSIGRRPKLATCKIVVYLAALLLDLPVAPV